MIMNLILSIIFIFMIHPLSMGLISILQTIIISMNIGKFMTNYWYSYMLFLILIGGMLIMFIYMTSIASNEKFKLNMILILPFSLSMIMLNQLINFLSKLNFKTNKTLQFNNNMIFSKSSTKYIYFPNNLILMMLIIYLLITLIMTVKITNFKFGPLRQK